jgi:AcrR family transcriptional regulator
MVFSDKQIQIIKTAEQLFAAKGFDGTTVRDIADEAGVNLAMISYYFGSKEKLMEALFEQRTGNIKMRVESLLKDDSLTPFQKIGLLVDEHIERMMHGKQFHRIMHCEQVINKNPAVINLIKEWKKKNTAIITQLIKDGQKKKAFKKKVDVVLLLSSMVGTINQMMINHEYYREINNLKNMPDNEFEELLKKNISVHIKNVFKTILINDA